jgi:hypothetical protein
MWYKILQFFPGVVTALHSCFNKSLSRCEYDIFFKKYGDGTIQVLDTDRVLSLRLDRIMKKILRDTAAYSLFV